MAPRHLLQTPDIDHGRQSISSTYSASQIPLTKHYSQCNNENFLTSVRHLSISARPNFCTPTPSIILPDPLSLCMKQRGALVSLIEKLKHDQAIPLLSSAINHQTIRPYGLTDTTPNSS